jgi:alkylation response protein AidB-like acyl-CoA dehydrogenase
MGSHVPGHSVMNFEISDDQKLMQESFARLLGEHSSMARVRAALPGGFDQALWTGLAELGAFSIRTPEVADGSDLGVLDAAILMEEVGRTLASGPIAETILTARLLAVLGGPERHDRLKRLLAGQCVVTLAYHDLADAPVQWLAGGAVAEAVIALDGDQVLLIELPGGGVSEPNLASTPIAECDLAGAARTVLAAGAAARRTFEQAIEEWKLLMAAALAGLSREAIRLAAEYAGQRMAFGQLIGTFQGISHPLADHVCEVDGGKYFTWKTIREIADGSPTAGAQISLTAWWNADAAGRAVQQALQTFGGYGLTTDYDIHLYNLRAKAWPLVFGDPWRLLEEAGRRFYGGEPTSLPDVGDVSIDFDMGEEAEALARETDAFFRKTLTPELKVKAHYSWDGHDPGLHKQIAEAGLLFPSWPRELGGRGAPPYAVRASRAVWDDHEWGSHAAGVTDMVGQVIRRFGSDDLKREVLTKIAAGEAICSLGYSEPGSGSDVFAAKTRATREADGWRIDGQKMFTSGANLADYVLLLARTNPGVPKHKGLTMFIVPLKAPGVTVHPVFTFQDERTNITYYDGVKVPDSYQLGEVDRGVQVMSLALELEHGAGYVKPPQRMLRAAEQLCREIRYRGRPLIEDPAAQARLARVAANTEIANVLTLRSLWAGVEKKPNPGFGPMARMFSADRFLRGAADLLDLTAPHALAKRTGPAAFLNQCYRHAHGTRIYGGTREVHRSVIAERNLGMPRTRA